MVFGGVGSSRWTFAARQRSSRPVDCSQPIVDHLDPHHRPRLRRITAHRALSSLKPFTDLDLSLGVVSAQKVGISQDPDGSFLSDPHTCHFVVSQPVDGMADGMRHQKRHAFDLPQTAKWLLPSLVDVMGGEYGSNLGNTCVNEPRCLCTEKPLATATSWQFRGVFSLIEVLTGGYSHGQDGTRRLRQPPAARTLVRTWTHADIDVAGGAALARSAPLRAQHDAFGGKDKSVNELVVADGPRQQRVPPSAVGEVSEDCVELLAKRRDVSVDHPTDDGRPMWKYA